MGTKIIQAAQDVGDWWRRRWPPSVNFAKQIVGQPRQPPGEGGAYISRGSSHPEEPFNKSVFPSITACGLSIIGNI
jgi:hypothetical protein